MTARYLSHRFILGSCLATALLAGCGGSQPPIGAPGAIPRPDAARARPHLAYVANFGVNSIAAYVIDARTGALKRVQGSPFIAGTNPGGIAIDPSGKFVYAANVGSNDVSAFAIRAADGVLTPVPGSPFAAGVEPWGVAIDPAGRFVYVTDAEDCNSCNGSVSVYAINANTGALAPINGSPFAAGARPLSIAIDSNGKFAYVANDLSANVSAYTISRSGALTPVQGSPFVAGLYPDSVAIDPVHRFVYESNFESSDVVGYAINGGTGGLKLLKKPFKTAYETAWLAINPAGTFACVTGEDPGVRAYAIGPRTGFLKKTKRPTFELGETGGVAFDPTGKFAYVAGTNSSGGQVFVFAISAIGALTPVSGSPFATGGWEPEGVAIW